MRNQQVTKTIHNLVMTEHGVKTREELNGIILLYRTGQTNKFIDRVNSISKLDLVNLVQIWQTETGQETHVIFKEIKQALIWALQL